MTPWGSTPSQICVCRGNWGRNWGGKPHRLPLPGGLLPFRAGKNVANPTASPVKSLQPGANPLRWKIPMGTRQGGFRDGAAASAPTPLGHPRTHNRIPELLRSPPRPVPIPAPHTRPAQCKRTFIGVFMYTMGASTRGSGPGLLLALLPARQVHEAQQQVPGRAVQHRQVLLLLLLLLPLAAFLQARGVHGAGVCEGENRGMGSGTVGF